jgi:hypothetical protein
MGTSWRGADEEEGSRGDYGVECVLFIFYVEMQCLSNENDYTRYAPQRPMRALVESLSSGVERCFGACVA